MSGLKLFSITDLKIPPTLKIIQIFRGSMIHAMSVALPIQVLAPVSTLIVNSQAIRDIKKTHGFTAEKK
jgi:hypothetical protein